ncbi:hypothetical protein [Natronococcus occultus]|uniref:Uncharacterized protein n=1 Tax=Natronococcus occultus SP4 TaxID=694430 RepID=L0JZH8_9EURY|nr:hypothetical protein [Natronococcus occultus]AGB37705.1 hypothetical protein Natoc_1915 [Natronococcus occultus SP4]
MYIRDGSARAKFDEHSEDDVEYVGATSEGTPMFFNTASRSIFEGEYDGKETVVDRPGTERELEDRASVGEMIENLGDELGWESLSEFGREHADDERA